MLQKLYLRSGYKLGYDAENFTAGIGVEAGRFQMIMAMPPILKAFRTCIALACDIIFKGI
jgi:hypothetical protein